MVAVDTRAVIMGAQIQRVVSTQGNVACSMVLFNEHPTGIRLCITAGHCLDSSPLDLAPPPPPWVLKGLLILLCFPSISAQLFFSERLFDGEEKPRSEAEQPSQCLSRAFDADQSCLLPMIPWESTGLQSCTRSTVIAAPIGFTLI